MITEKMWGDFSQVSQIANLMKLIPHRIKADGGEISLFFRVGGRGATVGCFPVCDPVAMVHFDGVDVPFHLKLWDLPSESIAELIHRVFLHLNGHYDERDNWEQVAENEWRRKGDGQGQHVIRAGKRVEVGTSGG